MPTVKVQGILHLRLGFLKPQRSRDSSREVELQCQTQRAPLAMSARVQALQSQVQRRTDPQQQRRRCPMSESITSIHSYPFHSICGAHRAYVEGVAINRTRVVKIPHMEYYFDGAESSSDGELKNSSMFDPTHGLRSSSPAAQRLLPSPGHRASCKMSAVVRQCDSEQAVMPVADIASMLVQILILVRVAPQNCHASNGAVERFDKTLMT